MHELFAQVLRDRDLSRAGDLFSVDDVAIEKDLSLLLDQIYDISHSKDYLTNANDQSVVEICITRITSAIRDTGSIESHASSLVKLLHSCLQHNLRPTTKGEHPPHAKIASDILSCLFMHYTKLPVMEKAIPVAVQFLTHANPELCRNMSSYLSLAAIDNVLLLSNHCDTILSSVLAGNNQLVRILPHIYTTHKQPVHTHIAQLVEHIDLCDDPEKINLLQLLGLVAQEKPKLLRDHIGELCMHLSLKCLCALVLSMFIDMVPHYPRCFIDQLSRIQACADTQPGNLLLVVQILGPIGTTNETMAHEIISYLTSRLSSSEAQTEIVKQIKLISEVYPSVLVTYIADIHKLSAAVPTAAKLIIQQLRDIAAQCLLTSSASSSQQHLPQMRAHPHAQPPPPHHRHSLTTVGLHNAATSTTSIPIGGDGPPPATTGHRSRANSRGAGGGGGGHRSSMRGSEGRRASRGSRGSLTASGVLFTAGSSGALTSNLSNSKHASTSTREIPYHPHQHAHTRASHTHNNTAGTGSTTHTHGTHMRVLSNSQRQLNQQKTASRGHQYGGFGSSSVAAVSPPPGTSGGSTLACGGAAGSARGSTDHHTSSANNILEQPTVAPTVSATNASSRHSLGSMQRSMTNMSVITAPSAANTAATKPPTAANSTSTLISAATAMQQPHSKQQSTSRTALHRDTAAAVAALHKDNTLQKDATLHKEGRRQNNNAVPYAQQPHSVVASHRDAVQQFCEKHLDKIKTYIAGVQARLPIPVKSTLAEMKHKRLCRLDFLCSGRGTHCLYAHRGFSIYTKNAKSWIHIMFLAIQARSSRALSQQESVLQNLKQCWEALRFESGSFVRLVTSSFPTVKDQDVLLQELHSVRYFDIFEFSGADMHWACFLCNHPEKADGLLKDGAPKMEGQLKEKKGKWKLFRRWKTRYFTLSGASISYSTKNTEKEALPISKIQSVKAIKKGARDIPKAFEIFTQDQSYVFKAKDSKHAEQWLQCLQIAVARTNSHSGTMQSNAADAPHEGSALHAAWDGKPHTIAVPQVHSHTRL